MEWLLDWGGYDDTIQAKNTAFDQKKSEKKHARWVIKYEKFLELKKVSAHSFFKQ